MTEPTWIDGPAASALLRMTPTAFRQYAHRHPDELPPGPIRNRRRCYDLEHIVRLAEARQLDTDEANRHTTNARTEVCP